jgi:hypothetical protein
MTRIRAFTFFAACALGAAACTDSSGGGTGKLTVQLTDAPFPFAQVNRVDVFVVRIDAKSAETDATEAANEANMSGWTTLATPNALINLLDLGGGKTTNLGEVTLATGTYRGFRLIIDPAQSSITLKDGTKPSVVWPSAARTGIKIVLDAPVSLTENGSVLVVDFDVGRSFVMRGNSISQNGLLFKPVLRGTAIDVTGSASGSVHGDNATGPVVVGATVEVLKAGTLLTDTDDANIVATTTTDATGNFKFGFLLPGTYALRATPPSGSVYTAALLSGGLTVTTGHETSGLVVVLGR